MPLKTQMSLQYLLGCENAGVMVHLMVHPVAALRYISSNLARGIEAQSHQLVRNLKVIKH
jgi:hypothetical protein